jgi:cell division protein FtsB
MSAPALRAPLPGGRVLSVRRPLVRPDGDPRPLLRVMRSRFARRVAVLGAVLVLLCLVQVWLRLQVVDIGYELSAARKLLQRLDHEHRQLRAELATLQDARALAEAAQAKLGLVEPRPGQVVELR